MAIKTVGTGKTYATIALAEAACSSGDTVELYDTVADGVPSVYHTQRINVTNTVRTYTAIDDVFIFDATGAGNTLAGTASVTLNNIKTLALNGTAGLSVTATGTTVLNGCIIVGTPTTGAILITPGGNNAIVNIYSTIGAAYNGNANGILINFTSARTAVVVSIYNCIGLGSGSGAGINSNVSPLGAGSTITVKNSWMYSIGAGADWQNTGTTATITNSYSPDGTAGNTCTVANAKFKDLDGLHSRFGLPDVAILAGSSLIGAGADPGVTISDVFGTSKATGSGTFDVGACFYSVTAAATAVTGAKYLNTTGNQYSVWWNALTNKESPRVLVTASGTDYYLYPAARTASGNDRCQIGFTTCATLSRFLHLPDDGTAFTRAGVTGVKLFSMNVCDIPSTSAAATLVSLEAHTANQVTDCGGGNYITVNLSVGNVRPVAFGLSLSGTLANLAITDAAYGVLENSRNNDNGTIAADIASGKTVKIRNVTTCGTAAGATVAPTTLASITHLTAHSATVCAHWAAHSAAAVAYLRYRTDGGAWSAESESYKVTGSGTKTVTSLTNNRRYWFSVYEKLGTAAGTWSAEQSAIPNAGATDIEQALYTYFAANGPIKSAVSSFAGAAKVFPDFAPQEVALPYIVFSKASDPGDHHMSAASTYAAPNFTIDCFATNKPQAKSISNTVWDALDGIRHTDFSGLKVSAVKISGQSNAIEGPDDGSGTPIARVSLDAQVWYSRTPPTF